MPDLFRAMLCTVLLCACGDETTESSFADVPVRDATRRIVDSATFAVDAIPDGARDQGVDMDPDAAVNDAAPDATDLDAQPADAGPDTIIAPDATPDAGPQAPCPDDMVEVPAGPFPFGLEDRPINLPAFCIHRMEVSAMAFVACAMDGACDSYERWPACVDGAESRPNQCTNDRLDHPANWIDWFRADQYCTWIGARLPESEEWEKAARGPEGRTWPWGERAGCDKAQYARIEPLNCIGQGLYGDITAPVDAYDFVDSPYGAINLAGNVAEWTEFREDPTVLPEDTDFAPARGGTYRDSAELIQGVRINTLLGAGRTSRGRGFRCAQDTFE